ncbi:MAG: phosphohistidine phosphatase SixA [Endozoicomonas sp.]
MQLIIMRHGQASCLAPSDQERVLTETGRAEVIRTVSGMNKLPVNRVISSPYFRAKETAEIAASTFGCDIELMDELVPEGNPQSIIDVLPQSGVVLLASHMPVVSYLAGQLCDGVPSLGPFFQTASALLLEMEVMAAGMARVKGSFYFG